MAACFLEVPEAVVVREATPAEEVIPPARLRKMFASWIIYKDADVVAINKPGGFSSQGVSQSVSQSVTQIGHSRSDSCGWGGRDPTYLSTVVWTG